MSYSQVLIWCDKCVWPKCQRVNAVTMLQHNDRYTTSRTDPRNWRRTLTVGAMNTGALMICDSCVTSAKDIGCVAELHCCRAGTGPVSFAPWRSLYMRRRTLRQNPTARQRPCWSFPGCQPRQANSWYHEADSAEFLLLFQLILINSASEYHH